MLVGLKLNSDATLELLAPKHQLTRLAEVLLRYTAGQLHETSRRGTGVGVEQPQ